MKIAVATGVVLSCFLSACNPDPAQTQHAVAERSGTITQVPPEVTPSPAVTVPSPPQVAATRSDLEPAPVMAGIPSPISMPPKGAETPPLAANAEVTYVCESGLPFVVKFNGMRAEVRMPDGREFSLTRGGSTASGAEQYSGSGVTMFRTANVVELTLKGAGSPMRCAESSGTA